VTQLRYCPRRQSVAAAVFTALVVALFASVLTVGSAHARAAPESFADLVDGLLPGVVNISTTQISEGGPRGFPGLEQAPPEFREFFEEFFERNRPEGPRRSNSLGSGFVIDGDGHIVTNSHVIEDAEEISVILHDNTQLEATVVGVDSKTDMALLKVDTDHPLQPLEWGDSDDLRVGDWVVAIGNPFGLGGTVTAGIVSARGRDINAGPYDDFIQTDASINRGNSGGPLFDVDGKVVGINTAIYSPQGGSIGIGFAVPSAIAKPVIEQLKEFGRTRRGWLGVRIQTVTDEIAESLGLSEARGALVASVTEDGPAEDAGIRQGDVILRFDDKPVEEMRELPRLVAETKVGSTVPVEVWRDGNKVGVNVTLGELEQFEQEAAAETPETTPETAPQTSETLGMSLSTLTPSLREQFEIAPNIEGVLVTDVDPASNAGEKGIRPGDIIVEMNSDPVQSPDEVEAKIDEARAAGTRTVLLYVERAGDRRFVALRLG